MKELKIKVAYLIGEKCYVKTDPEQYQRLIVGYQILPNSIVYICSFCNTTSNFYEVELSREQDVMMKINGGGTVN